MTITALGIPRGYKHQPLADWGPLFATDDEAVFQHPWFLDLDQAVVGRFRLFHAEHPGLLELFAKYARAVRASGKKGYGIAAVMERARWFQDIETMGTEGDQFKLNNSWRSCYARMLMLKYPELDGLFELRTTHGGNDHAD